MRPSQRQGPASLKLCSPDELLGSLLERAEVQFPLELLPDANLLPDRYSGDDYMSDFRWATECCWTDDDAGMRIAQIPAKEYIENFCYIWNYAFKNRIPFICQKSRRLLISWLCTSLELRQILRARSNGLICDMTSPKSANHLWRFDFMLKQLLIHKNKEFRHINWRALGSDDARETTDLAILSNGSLVTQTHQAAASIQGAGKTFIRLEELSRYDYPAAMFSQVKFVTMGEAGNENAGGGFISVITNQGTNPDYQMVKTL